MQICQHLTILEFVHIGFGLHKINYNKCCIAERLNGLSRGARFEMVHLIPYVQMPGETTSKAQIINFLFNMDWIKTMNKGGIIVGSSRDLDVPRPIPHQLNKVCFKKEKAPFRSEIDFPTCFGRLRGGGSPVNVVFPRTQATNCTKFK